MSSTYSKHQHHYCITTITTRINASTLFRFVTCTAIEQVYQLRHKTADHGFRKQHPQRSLLLRLLSLPFPIRSSRYFDNKTLLLMEPEIVRLQLLLLVDQFKIVQQEQDTKQLVDFGERYLANASATLSFRFVDVARLTFLPMHVRAPPPNVSIKRWQLMSARWCVRLHISPLAHLHFADFGCI